MSTKSVSRAFQKMHVTRKSRQISDIAREYFDIVFRWAIPEAVQDMPPRGMYFVGLMSIFTAALLFVVIVWITYDSNIKSIYLSPNDSGYCSPVDRPITGIYIADTNGSWNSNIFYDSSRAIYEFHFQEFQSNGSYWSDMILGENGLQVALQYVGNAMKTQPLSGNIIYWLAWVGNFDVHGAAQYLTFYSDVSVVFDRQYVHGGISNQQSDCNATSSSKYDVGSYVLSTVYSYAEFSTNPRCNLIVNPHTLGYDPLYDGDEFTLSYDVRSLVTALAINNQILGLAALRPVSDSLMPFEYKNTSYATGLWYNPRFPGMNPIFCTINLSELNNVTRSSNVSCFFTFKNGTYAIPLLNSAGGSYTDPDYCTCVNSDGSPGPGAYSGNCNVFNFLSGFLLFDYNMNLDYGTSEYKNPFFDILDTVPLPQMSQYAYTAMFMTAAESYTNYFEGNTTMREEAYSFCDLGYTTCSIVTINSFDTNNRAVSNYFYEIMNGSCTDTVTVSQASYDKLAAVPPAPLIESYYKCKKTPLSVLSAAIGITVGNINAIVPILFLIFVQGYFVILYYEGKPPVQTYTKEERDDALKALALQLLMMRDNRLPPRRSGSLYKAYPNIYGDSAKVLSRETVGQRSSSPSRSDSTSSMTAGAGTGTGVGTDTGVSAGDSIRGGSYSGADSWNSLSIPGANADGGVGAAGSMSILRLLTDELMENAYINVYFNLDAEEEAQKQKQQFRRNSQLRRRTLQTKGAYGGDIEGAGSVPHDDDGIALSPMHGSIDSVDHDNDNSGIDGTGDGTVDVLNSVFDGSLDTMVEYDCTKSDATAAERLAATLDSLMNRLIATAVDGAEEDFWEISAHTAVLHRMDLDVLSAFVLAHPTTYRTYVSLLMKIYQLMQVHIRISYGCNANEAHAFDHSTAYIIGPKGQRFTVADIEQLYNDALAYALLHHLKLDPM